MPYFNTITGFHMHVNIALQVHQLSNSIYIELDAFQIDLYLLQSILIVSFCLFISVVWFQE